MNPIGQAFAQYQPRKPGIPTMSPADPELDNIRDDREWFTALAARRAANKIKAYTRHLPARYAAASYATLRPAQNPRNQLGTWLTRGPRALILAGPSRTGKTTGLFAITNAASQAGQWVIARTAISLSAGLKPDAEPLLAQHLTECDLLAIDDLGRERATDWWLEQLQHVVDARCSNMRRLIVTVNTEPDAAKAFTELAARYGDPIAERLLDGAGLTVFDGPAIREVIRQW